MINISANYQNIKNLSLIADRAKFSFIIIDYIYYVGYVIQYKFLQSKILLFILRKVNTNIFVLSLFNFDTDSTDIYIINEYISTGIFRLLFNIYSVVLNLTWQIFLLMSLSFLNGQHVVCRLINILMKMLLLLQKVIVVLLLLIQKVKH